MRFAVEVCARCARGLGQLPALPASLSSGSVIEKHAGEGVMNVLSSGSFLWNPAAVATGLISPFEGGSTHKQRMTQFLAEKAANEEAMAEQQAVTDAAAAEADASVADALAALQGGSSSTFAASAASEADLERLLAAGAPSSQADALAMLAMLGSPLGRAA